MQYNLKPLGVPEQWKPDPVPTEISGRLSIDLSGTIMRPHTRTRACRPVVIGNDKEREPSLPSKAKMWLQGHELEKHNFACRSTRFDIDSSKEQHGGISKHFRFSPAEDFCQVTWRLLFSWSADGSLLWSCLALSRVLDQMTSRLYFKPKLLCNFQCWWIKVLSVEVNHIGPSDFKETTW